MISLSSAPVSATQATDRPEPMTSGAAEKEKIAAAARQFEAIFVRSLLAPLEKTEAFGGSESGGSGSDIYGSMMVSALADAATQGNGIGLSEIILKALSSAGLTKSGPATDK